MIRIQNGRKSGLPDVSGGRGCANLVILCLN